MDIAEKYYIKSIKILKNTNWCGKWLSKYSIYELIFHKFVIDLKNNGDTNVKILIKQKNNDFIKKLIKDNYYLLQNNEEIILEKNIYIKLYFIDENIEYLLKYNIHIDENKIINFIFILDNIIMLSISEEIYILNNIIKIEDIVSTNNNENLVNIIKNIIEYYKL